MTAKPGWKQLKEGDILEAGTSQKFTTADWRSERPIFHKERCIDCKLCWVYCPDSSILLDENKKVCGIDLEHCKGCGICSFECPVKPEKAITMQNEHK
ncbi:4Fe-4S binding protein [Candidatus Saganbacteria bacterium]|nr:4Fe-4S binding protein [Candidatus Saganbacteria bacterium]